LKVLAVSDSESFASIDSSATTGIEAVLRDLGAKWLLRTLRWHILQVASV
jgi:hypothetical protein